MVLHRGRFCPPGYSWQCLETFFIITTRGVWWWRPRVLLNILQCTKRSLQPRIAWPQMVEKPVLLGQLKTFKYIGFVISFDFCLVQTNHYHFNFPVVNIYKALFRLSQIFIYYSFFFFKPSE